MASAQAWSIEKRWASKFEEFLRTSSAGHLAVSLIKGDCVYVISFPMLEGMCKADYGNQCSNTNMYCDLKFAGFFFFLLSTFEFMH